MANNESQTAANSIDTSTFNSITRLTGVLKSPKYGDSDVSSKRRKSNGEPDMNDGTLNPIDLIKCSDEVEYMNFEQLASISCLNSSLLEHLDQNLDFKGGLLKGNIRKSEIPTKPNEPKPPDPSTAAFDTSSTSKISAKNNLIITEKPSPTSKGFENTFKLLQNQVTCKNRSNLLNHPIDCVSATRLDLELEAQQQLRVLHASTKTVSSDENCTCCTKKQFMKFLRDFTEKSIPEINVSSDSSASEASNSQNINDELSAPDSHIEPDGINILYHATMCADGTKRLRVLRNTAVSKSKVLCGNRVSQMTRAYDDIEAVTRLLEEKEKDLELTVQIGRELLTQNNSLENRISELEADLKESNDDRAQLVHELNKKNELIAVLTNDADDGSEAETPTFSKSVTVDLLQRKVNSLQDENKSLKMEASQLAKQTDDVEAHERKLMEDISSQLNEANSQFESLSLELERQREENRLQHEQIVSLTARLAEAEMRLHQLTHDNDEHITLLGITKQNQNSLALELVEFKQRYQEVLELLQETQEQLRKQRKRTMPQARSGSFMSGMVASGMSGSGYGFLQPDSLQSELIESTISDNSLDSGIVTDRDRANDRIGRLMSQLANNSDGATASALGGACLNRVGGGTAIVGAVPPYQRVFETVRCATKSGNYSDSSGVNSISMSQLGAMSMSSSSGPRMSAVAVPAGSYYRHDSMYDGYNAMGGGKTLSCESLNSQPDENYPSQPEGVPGAPGAKDLEAALKRLTPAEVLARRAMLSYAPAGTYNYDEQQQQHSNQKYHQQSSTLPLGVRTPDSIMSTGSSGISSSAHMSASMHQWRLPEKLQIIKPMEGSQTLHHWSRLATPTLSGLLEKRPGVTIRGGRGLDDLGMQIYTLEDVEEDISEDLPGKQFEAPGCTYTFTNSMVMHPDDGIVNDLSFLSQSQMSSRMASTSTSRQPSCPPTPRSGLSRKNSCSTFSVNLGLASMLNERGIKAVTPSALNTPAGPNFSPTVTPCNSPEGSPTRSRSPEPLFGLISSGADLIRRKLIGGDIDRPTRNQQKQHQQKILLSRLERRALRSLRLVEQVERIGLENIIAASQPCAMSQLASGIADRSSSPMAQLTSFKSLHTSSNSIVDDIHFERDQIKSVLHKGLNKSSKSNKYTSDSSSSAYTSDNDSTLSDNSDNSFRNDYRTSTNSARRNEESSHTIIAQKNIDIQSQSTTAPKTTIKTTAVAQTVATLPSQTETRIKQMQRQKSRRSLKNGMAAQRPDLGRVRNDLGKVEKPPTNATNTNQEASKTPLMSSSMEKDSIGATQSITQSFVGTVSSLLFGRKGGWL